MAAKTFDEWRARVERNLARRGYPSLEAHCREEGLAAGECKHCGEDSCPGWQTTAPFMFKPDERIVVGAI